MKLKSKQNKIGKRKKVYYRQIFLKRFETIWNRLRTSRISPVKHLKISIFILLVLSSSLSFIYLIVPNINSFEISAFSLKSNNPSIITSVNTDAPLLSNQDQSGDKATNFSEFKKIDNRAFILDQYFKASGSPLYGTGKDFVASCDKYGMPKDCIGMVAIAKHETNLCKYYFSADMHNCWGFGGGGSNRWSFNNFSEAIDTTTRLTMNGYGTAFFLDFRNGQDYFCGTQSECIGWGNRVNNIARQIDDFSEGVGLGRLTSYR